MRRTRTRPPHQGLRRTPEPPEPPRRKGRILPPARSLPRRPRHGIRLGLHPDRQARRQARRGRLHRQRPRRHLHPLHHAPVPLRRILGSRLRRPRRPPQDHRCGRQSPRRRRRGTRRDHGPVLARQAPHLLLQGKAPPHQDAHHPAAHHRHLLPRRDRRHLLHPRPLRRGQDRASALHQPLCRDRRGRDRGLRRTRRRSRGNPPRISHAGRPAHGQDAHGPLGHHLQHQLHAGGRP